MFEKIKRYIHKIKRHRRNKRLSKFADAMFEASSRVCYKIGIHPLVYEIINFRHHDSFTLWNLFPDYHLSDYYRITLMGGGRLCLRKKQKKNTAKAVNHE